MCDKMAACTPKKTQNKCGPSIDPCGTPYLTFEEEDTNQNTFILFQSLHVKQSSDRIKLITV